MNKSNYVNISPETLIKVCDECLNNIKNYDAESNFEIVYIFSLKSFIKEPRKLYTYPNWALPDCGIITRLNQLKAIAEEVIKDRYVRDRDIKLSLTTHTNLYKILHKDSTFEPYIFGLGY